jgi:hypothetical protein
LELVVAGCYWWHPVVWWARRAIHAAEEQCCDAWVVWALPQAARAYGKALLQTVEFLDARPVLPAAASGIGHVRFLQRRLAMIVQQPPRPWVPWPVQLAAVALGLVVLPLAPQRLQAQAPDDTSPRPERFQKLVPPEPDSTAPRAERFRSLLRAEQVAQGQPGGRDRDIQDMERRLDRLERQMDRLLRAMERGARGPGATPAPGGKFPPGGLPGSPAPGVAPVPKFPPGGLPGGAPIPNPQPPPALRGPAPRPLAPQPGAPLGPTPAYPGQPGQPVPPRGPQMDQIHRQIQEAVERAINPERMKALQKEIQDAVNQAGLDPKNMKQLHDRIEQAVRQSINPERMKALQQKIESTVQRALRDEERQRSRAKPKGPTPEAGRNPRLTPPAAPRGRAPDTRDLERRLDRLEQKMDRLIDSLQRRQPVPDPNAAPPKR